VVVLARGGRQRGVDPRQLFVAELDVHRAAFTSGEPSLRIRSFRHPAHGVRAWVPTSLPPRAIPVFTASAHSAYRSAAIRDGG
jgi:hypothetical protein